MILATVILGILAAEYGLSRYLHRREQRNLKRHCADIAERDRRAFGA